MTFPHRSRAATRREKDDEIEALGLSVGLSVDKLSVRRRSIDRATDRRHLRRAGDSARRGACTERTRIRTSEPNVLRYDTIRYEMLFERALESQLNLNLNQLNLPHGTDPTTKKCRNRKTISRKQICSEITVNSLGNPCSES